MPFLWAAAPQNGGRSHPACAAIPQAAFIPQPQLSEVEAAAGADPAFSAMVGRYRRAPVPVSSYGVTVQTAHVGPTAEEQAVHRQAGAPPLVLLHGEEPCFLAATARAMARLALPPVNPRRHPRSSPCVPVQDLTARR